jgi:hypothetical protein
MTDSTFESLAPYTLPILHAIVANESMPIAFGISPTETADAYSRIYDNIRRLGRQRAWYDRFWRSPGADPTPHHDNSVADWPAEPDSVLV